MKNQVSHAVRNLILVLLLIIFSIFVLIVIYCSLYGPSIYQDDHWYMNDMRSLILTGKMQTNQVFPTQVFKNEYESPKVLHNLPLMYGAIPFVILFGSYWGWIVTNLIYTLLTLVFLLLILYKLKGFGWESLLFCVLFLFWIMTLHSASHPIAESGVLFYLVVMAYMLINVSKRYLYYMLIGLLTAVIILNRPSFVGLIILLPIYLMKQQEQDILFVIKHLLIYFGALIICLLMGIYLLPQFRAGILTPSIMPHGKAMLHFFTRQQNHFDLSVVVSRVVSEFKLQLTGRDLIHLPFVSIFNLMMLYFICTKPKARFGIGIKLFYVISIYLLIYLSTLLCFQYQTRFLNTVMPFLLLWCFYKLPDLSSKYIYYSFFTIFIIVNLVGDVLYIKKNREEAKVTSQIESAYTNIRNKYQPKGSIIVSGNSKLVPWVFVDNKHLLMVDISLLNREDLTILVDKIKPEWMICERNSCLLDSLSTYRPYFLSDLPMPMSEFCFYKLQKF